MNQIQPIITATLAAGSTASPFLLTLNVTQQLCETTCADAPIIFTPSVSVDEWAQVDTGLYVVTCHVDGICSYTPCQGGPCCTRTQLVAGAFTVPVYAAKAPTAVTITTGQTINTVSADPCHRCSRLLVSETPVILTVQ
jgi:hypothetical protein